MWLSRLLQTEEQSNLALEAPKQAGDRAQWTTPGMLDPATSLVPVSYLTADN